MGRVIEGERVMSKSGIYMATLKNDVPIGVNAHDPRYADKCLLVSRGNVKVGKAKDFASRRKTYFKVFGEENIKFTPLVTLENIAEAERAVLRGLRNWQMRHNRRLHEWLAGISPEEVERIVMEALANAGIDFKVIGKAQAQAAPTGRAKEVVEIDADLWDQAEAVLRRDRVMVDTAIVLMLETTVKEGRLPFDAETPNPKTARVLRESLRGEDVFGTYENVEEALEALLEKTRPT